MSNEINEIKNALEDTHELWSLIATHGYTKVEASIVLGMESIYMQCPLCSYVLHKKGFLDCRACPLVDMWSDKEELILAFEEEFDIKQEMEDAEIKQMWDKLICPCEKYDSPYYWFSGTSEVKKIAAGLIANLAQKKLHSIDKMLEASNGEFVVAYEACHDDVILEKDLTLIGHIGEKIETLKKILKEYGVSFDTFSNAYACNGFIYNLDEHADDRIYSQYHLIQEEFERLTGLNIYIGYHDPAEGSIYDTVRGPYWWVTGMHQYTPEGEKIKHIVKKASWVVRTPVYNRNKK